MSIYVGINIGKFFHLACFLNNGGNQVDELKFNNDYQGFSELEKLSCQSSISDDETSSNNC